MKGIIQFISSRRGMVGVRTENEEFSVLELFRGCSPEIGDVITGNLENLGEETVKNVTQGEFWDVFIQDIHGSKQIVVQMLEDF